MSQSESRFSVGRARRIVHDLFRPRPRVYWTDFLVSIAIAYSGAGLYLEDVLPLGGRAVAYVIAIFALYRVSLFMHEIVHFRRGEMTSFKVAWNVLAGIPMLTPSFFYESHIAHHNTHHYGTRDDGEYLPLGHGAMGDILFFISQVFLQPLVVVTRFLLGPLSFLHPRLRQWTLEHASSFVINLHYRRAIAPEAPRRAWAAMDLACSLRTWVIFVAPFWGITEWTRVPMLYGLAVGILTLNYLRTVAAHRYLSTGERMSHEEQFFDSTNITGGPWTELICPVGLRYHALHHLFPSLPYHNLGDAHQRLMAELPQDSEYRDIVYPSMMAVLRDMRKTYLRDRDLAPDRRRQWYGELPSSSATTDDVSAEPSTDQEFPHETPSEPPHSLTRT